MCGICGFVGDERFELMDHMSAAMVHRGPDDVGHWHDPARRVGLGHRRLAVLDLSAAGRQPMANEEGSVHLTFNGEIYNYPELRKYLQSRGHIFQSNTDSEVLVHLYEEKGQAMLDNLNGMFAFAIWDARKQELLLARDHAGIKPLYYWQSGSKLYFASEIKALLQIPEIPRQLNHARLRDYLTFLWIPGDQSMFEGLHKLEPGQCMTWSNGQTRIRRWFTLNYEPDDSFTEDEWIEQVGDTFNRAVRRQMASDVPLGAFLSGGVDSSSIVAGMRAAYPGKEIRCYHARVDSNDIGFDQFEDDYPFAKTVAEHLGAELREFCIRPDITDLLPKMVWHLDEPDADPAMIPSYLIARAAREDGTTVLLSGTGGDEMFFGYRSHIAYDQYARMPRMLKPAVDALCAAVGATGAIMGAQNSLLRRAAKFRRGLAASGFARHLALVDWSTTATRRRLFGDGLDDTPYDAMQRCYDSFVGTGDLNRHSHILIQTFLAAHNLLYTDKTSMACSVEVRVPFLDLELMRLCARIPQNVQMKNGVTKHLLKEAMKSRLPAEVLHRSKTGFMAPLRKWINHDLAEMVGDSLSESRLKSRGLFRPDAVREIIAENRAGRADHAYLIYALLTLEVWLQTFVDRVTQPVPLT